MIYIFTCGGRGALLVEHRQVSRNGYHGGLVLRRVPCTTKRYDAHKCSYYGPFSVLAARKLILYKHLAEYYAGCVLKFKIYTRDCGRKVHQMKPVSFATVWRRIIVHAGKTFWTKTGVAFTYKVTGNHLIPTHTARNIPKTDYQSAYSLVPFTGPAVINRTHQGPAFIWGVLHDPRISGVFSLLGARAQSQYYPLELFLKCIPISTKKVTLSFAQIDLILRIALPNSAFRRREWWVNDKFHVQAIAWINAGFKVDRNGVNFVEKWVRFSRGSHKI